MAKLLLLFFNGHLFGSLSSSLYDIYFTHTQNKKFSKNIMYLTHGLTYVKLLTRLRFIATGMFIARTIDSHRTSDGRIRVSHTRSNATKKNYLLTILTRNATGAFNNCGTDTDYNNYYCYRFFCLQLGN